MRLDFGDPGQRAEARRLRNHEVPFVLFNVPAVEEVARKWRPEYLARQFADDACTVRVSQDNHFMYHNRRLAEQYASAGRSYAPPTAEAVSTFSQWLEATSRLEEGWAGGAFPWGGRTPTGDRRVAPHRYLASGAGCGDGFLARDLDGFSGQRPSLFVHDVARHRGPHCRFAQPGTVTEAHFDAGRNFVAMLRGAKRYVLLPPSEAALLYLRPKGHPEGRHSAADWSAPSVFADRPLMAGAVALEHVLRRGEVLYIPSFWFHFIVATELSFQCNVRSGVAQRARGHLSSLGFPVGPHAPLPV
jgi:hypothetical protein